MKLLSLKIMSGRNLLTLLTMAALFHGTLELKSFLMENFVDNDTVIKRKVNRALNGYPAGNSPGASAKTKKSEEAR